MLGCFLEDTLSKDTTKVIEVVQRAESLKKISLLAHSLGGLFARHAIAILYSPNNLGNRESDDISKVSSIRKHDLIAGLEPVNFVNLATPHHGVRERKQPPLVVGIPVFEKLCFSNSQSKGSCPNTAEYHEIVEGRKDWLC